MNAFLYGTLLSFALSAPSEQPMPRPQPLAGDVLPTGAVARLGPDVFRHAGWVSIEVQCSPDGKRIGAVSTCGVYVWNAVTGKRLLWVPSDERTVTDLIGFQANGDAIVSCCRKWDRGGAGVFRIDPVSGKVNAKFQPEEERKFYTATPDGKVVFSRTRINDFRDENIATELDTGREVWRRKMPEMNWMRISPEGSRLVVWSSRGRWDPEILNAVTGKTLERFLHPDNRSHPTWTGGGVAVGPKAEWVVGCQSWDRGFSIFKSGTENLFHRHPKHWYDNAFITRDGKRAVFSIEWRGKPGRPLKFGIWPRRSGFPRSSRTWGEDRRLPPMERRS